MTVQKIIIVEKNNQLPNLNSFFVCYMLFKIMSRMYGIIVVGNNSYTAYPFSVTISNHFLFIQTGNFLNQTYIRNGE